ncbi:hypothetical protein EV361DRAFT_871917 [Lentinula raphanica]|uniref:Uncharacterized protein n=1 Tax=Lentinula raphanica TaxID=153919 RepID=A0AA38PE78_9AGAR|nr:hypothetical protein F5878DRAFT_22417 [Lentinula raphanica]KAJ3967074.1 hypothetical protein EV361DRAFT_871917 [Lentinula raphanica]
MIFSRPNRMMLIAALGMISVLALPVPDEIDVSTAPSASSINMIVHARSDPSQVDSMSKRMVNSGQPPPLEPVEPQTSASGAPAHPMYRQQGAPGNSVQPASCPLPPPGGRQFRRKPQIHKKDRTIADKISGIKQSHFYELDEDLQRYLETNLFSQLPSSGKRRNISQVKAQKIMPLLNAYAGLALEENQVKDEIERIRELLKIYPQCQDVYGPLIGRFEKKHLESNDMINIGLADPNHYGSFYLDAYFYEEIPTSSYH